MTLIDIEPLLAEGWILARTVPTRYGKTTQTMSLAAVETVQLQRLKQTVSNGFTPNKRGKRAV